MSKQELIDALMDLAEDERLEISEMLYQTVSPMSEEIEKAWIEESERRYQAIRDGTMETVSYEEVFGN